MKKRILSILLICCMVFSLFPVSALAASSDMPFTDVKTTDWFYKEVCYVYDEALMQGTSATTFDPNGTTNRGMIVTILYRLEGEPALMNDNVFTDVESGSWYEKAVVWANGKGIVEGYGNGKFGPDDPITREQLAAIMYRYANYKGYDVSEAADLSGFVDSGKISGYALDAMKWANAAGLITGIGASKLDPQGYATRAQVAAIFYRFCGAFVTKDTCKVSFDLNYENAGTYTTQNVKTGEKAAQPTAPTRSGYTFAGWYTKDVGGTKFDFGTAITADLTLYAHWTKNGGNTPYTPTYTVTFDMQGHGEQIAALTGLSSGAKVTAPDAPTEAGYTFEGWYKEAACETAWTFESDTITALTTTLYAKWTAKDTAIEEAVADGTEIKADGNAVTVTSGDDKSAATLEAAQATELAGKINDLLENSAVAGDYDNGLKTSTKIETTGLEDIIDELKKATSDATAKGNLDGKTEEDIDLQIKVVLSAVNVKATDDLTVTSMEFDVTPIATTTVKDSSGKTVSVTADVSDCLTTEVAFRLPIDSSLNLPGNSIAVYHEGKFLGNYEIQGDAPNTYIEIESADFSIYSYQLLNENNAGAKIGTTLYFKFADAVAKVENSQTVTLLKPATGSAAVGREVNFTVDKNSKAFNATVSAGTGYALYKTDETQSPITYKCFPVNTQFTITYKDQGDTAFTGTHGASHPTTHTYGTATTLVAPTRTGYAFKGWFTNKDCTGTAVTSLGATEYAENITLYAKWVETKTMAEILATNSGIPEVQDLTPPTDAWVKSTDPDCKAFIGVDADGDKLFVVKKQDQELITKFGLCMDDTFEKIDGNTYQYVDDVASVKVMMTEGKFTSCELELMIEQLKVLDGTYTSPASTVTFDLNGATGKAPDPQTVKNGEKATKPNDPTFANHTFAGWYKTKDATTGKLSDKWDFDTNTVTANMTLYAKWTRTLGNILDTVKDFPTQTLTTQDAYKTAPEDAWVSGTNTCYKATNNSEKQILALNNNAGEHVAAQLLLETSVTLVKGNYIYDAGIEFAMTGGVLSSITCNFQSAYSDQYGVYNGTYAESVKYLVWDNTKQRLVETTTSNFIKVTGSTSKLEGGKIYVVEGEVTRNSPITVDSSTSNPATLVLADGAKLTVKGSSSQAGINFGYNKALIITCQSGGTGELVATGSNSGSAGIGGMKFTLTINGGTITATGGKDPMNNNNCGAGIGGNADNDGGNVTINGGTVKANSDGGAGIGAGSGKSNHGTLTFNTTFLVKTGTSSSNVNTAVDMDSYQSNHSAKYVSIQEAVEYLDWDSINNLLVKKITADFIEVTNKTTTLDAGKFYVVKGEDVQTGALTVTESTTGIAWLILADGAKLTVTGGSGEAGINVGVSRSLHITGQSGGTGTLIANGGANAAGIGGKAGSGANATTFIMIFGGTITATGGEGAPGIGPIPDTGVHNIGVSIYGGKITATGGEGAQAIGKGKDSSVGVNLTFGEGVDFLVKAGDSAPGSEVTQATYASSHTQKYASIEVDTSVKYMDWNAENQQLFENRATEYTEITSETITLDAGKFYVVRDTVTTGSLTVNGTAESPTTLILCDGAQLTATGGDYQAGIRVCSGNALIITGQSNGSGKLIAKGGRWSAGIGGDSDSTNGGNITINGGKVTATGGDKGPSEYGTGGAGIGGGSYGSGATVTVNGGEVIANGNANSAGIGSSGDGGDWGNGGTFTINGGTVTATGGSNGAGIGGGSGGSGAKVTINGGTVTATGKDGGEAIGRGSGDASEGTVAFGECVACDVYAGDNAPGSVVNQDTYAGDHSAKYVLIEESKGV